MKSFNDKLREWERLCENLPGGPGDFDEYDEYDDAPDNDIGDRKAWAGQE